MHSSRTTCCDKHLMDDVVIRSVRRAKQKRNNYEKLNFLLQSICANSKTKRVTTGSRPRESIRFTGLTNNMNFGDTSLSLKGVDEARRDDVVKPTGEELSHSYQLGAGLGKRLQDLLSTVTKMSGVLLSSGTQDLSEEEDVDRTIKRCVEFDAMFARNHLYEIQRQLKEVKQLTVSKLSNPVELESKISTAVKCVTQALQVYTKHVGKGSRPKFQQTVPIFESIALINSLLEKLTGQRTFPFRQDLEVACSYLKQILLEINTIETRTVSTASRRQVRVRQKFSPSSDLSMYSRRMKNGRRKKARGKIERSKEETSTLIEKQTVENGKSVPIIHPIKSQLHVKPDSKAKDFSFRNATRAVPEERVKTMMESIPYELEESQLCVNDRAFQAIELLNESSVSKESVQSKEQEGSIGQILIPKESTEHVVSKAITAQRENVKLIFLKEDDKIGETQELPKQIDNGNSVPLDLIDGDGLPDCKEKLVQLITQSSQYDARAVASVDKLANHILTDMIVDFQKEEMDKVVEMLFRLEFK